MRPAVPLLILCGLAGCAADPSYVSGVGSGADAAVLAGGAAKMIASRMPADGAALTLATAVPPGNPVSPALADLLRARRVPLTDPNHPGAHRARYAVLPIEGAMVVTVTVDGLNAAQAFGRDHRGGLVPNAPMLSEQPSQDALP